ncbi:MAG: hypothetical protein K1060chlam1_01526 [Candidatus Anoxychlamydiales bacterium]|nr:hypothetical protein [Candidatus Anoxychlamydiales bacterium]
MKKYIFIFFSICFLFCQQNFLYSDDLTQLEQSLKVQNDKEDNYPVFDTPEYKPAFFKMLLILIALIALIFLTFWIFRRLMRMRLSQANLTKNIKILEKRAISPKSLLYIIEIDGKKVLISESNLEVRKIKDLE